MRLINVDDYSFREFIGNGIPVYSILSHTWGDGEVSNQDMQSLNDSTRQKLGFEKIRFACEQSARDGLKWTWVDTCCIDKTNNAELAEAINSMFAWYRDAARCYVYLSDVSGTVLKRKRGRGLSSPPWESAFRESRWFTRGWTLQELIAPASVQFFARNGALLGDKTSLEKEIHEITGIAVQALRGDPLAGFDIGERFKWAENRQTTREEDSAYSLLGIFGVFIAPIYGEGKANAVRRLRREIEDAARPRVDTQNLETFLVPYPRNDAFIGRITILEKLRQLPLKSTAQVRASLFGLGGIGKTQIALEYAYWIREACPEMSVFWVHTSSAERFRQAYVSIAQECMVPGYDNPKTDVLVLVKRWMESKDRGRWLMVIDNVDDAQLFFGGPAGTIGGASDEEGGLARYVPECAHGMLLATTRNKQLASRFTKRRLSIEVGKMSDDESERLLRDNLGGDYGSDELSALSTRLEHLPLALAQAVAFIQENTISVSQYLGLLDKSDRYLVELLSEEFETVGRDSETPRAVTETWILSFEQIQKQNAFACKILSLMSLFDRQAIPTEFLSEYSQRQHGQGTGREIQLTKALGLLKAFSFVVEEKSRGLNMHRLVQLVTRKWLVEKGMIRHFAGQALLVVTRTYPKDWYGHRETCRRYLPHAYAVLKLEGSASRERVSKAALFRQVGIFLYVDGRIKESVTCLEEWHRWESFYPEEDNQLRLSSQHVLAGAYQADGQVKKAVGLLEHVVAVQENVLAEDHPSRLASQHELAGAYQADGQVKKAVGLLEHVVAVEENVLAEDHPSRLASQHELARAYQADGQVKKAVGLLEHVVAVEENVLAEDHPDRLASERCLRRYLRQLSS